MSTILPPPRLAVKHKLLRHLRQCRDPGELGLFDRRQDNGPAKLSPRYLEALERAVRSSPQAYGWSRPTWTRELLVLALRRQTGVSIHPATMSRALHAIRARRG